jgi:hypothetical protein
MKRSILLVPALLLFGLASTACEPVDEASASPSKKNKSSSSSQFIQSNAQYCVTYGTPLIESQVPFLMDLVSTFAADQSAEGVANSGNKLAAEAAEVADEMSSLTKPGNGVSKSVARAGTELRLALASLGRAKVRAYNVSDVNVMTNKIDSLTDAVSGMTSACKGA